MTAAAARLTGLSFLSTISRASCRLSESTFSGIIRTARATPRGIRMRSSR
jgi:hypothetical protein